MTSNWFGRFGVPFRLSHKQRDFKVKKVWKNSMSFTNVSLSQ